MTAAETLGRQSVRAGTYPYQWLFPGPNARQVRPDGSILTADAWTAAAIMSYKVPQGMRFSLRGIVFSSDSPDWRVASGSLIWKLTVNGVSPRNVDFFNDVSVPLGSFAQPWPIPGRLEFESLSTLSMTATADGTIGAGLQFGMLIGHIYPNGEAGEG